MKKFNKKFNKRLALISSLIIALMGLFFFSVAVDSGMGVMESLGLTGGGVSYCVMAAVGNIGRVTDRETSGAQISSKLWIIALDQVDDTVQFPRPNASGEVGTVPLKAGEYMHYFEAIDDSLDDKSTGSKGDITTAVTNTFSFIMGGYRRALQKFMEEHAGDRFIIIYQMATDAQYYIVGNELKPMIFKAFDRTNNKESRSVSFTFENNSFLQPQKYTGAIVKEAPAAIAANATNLGFTSSAQYITSSANSAATTIATISGLAAADEGRIVEILGGGGANPTNIESIAAIVLKNDTTWVGKAGSRLTLKVLDSETLVEVSRIQTA